MALIPGIFVKGKFIPFNQVTKEQLEEHIRWQRVKVLIVLGLSAFFTATIFLALFSIS